MNDPIDLSLLRVFDALMRHRSVSAAARELGLTQPSVSNALSRLRTGLGDRLLERQGNRMVPSARASALWLDLADGLARIEAALAASREFQPATAQGVFRVGMHDYAQVLLGARLGQELRDSAPGMTLECFPVGSDAEDEMLRQGTLDLILRSGDRPSPGLNRETLIREDFVGLAAPGHPLLAGPLTLPGWLATPQVLVSSRGMQPGNVDMALRALGLARRIGCTVHGLDLAARMTASTRMVMTAGRHVAPAIADSHGLVRFELPLEVPGFDLVMLWNRRDDTSPSLGWLRETLKDVCRGR